MGIQARASPQVRMQFKGAPRHPGQLRKLNGTTVGRGPGRAQTMGSWLTPPSTLPATSPNRPCVGPSLFPTKASAGGAKRGWRKEKRRGPSGPRKEQKRPRTSEGPGVRPRRGPVLYEGRCPVADSPQRHRAALAARGRHLTVTLGPLRSTAAFPPCWNKQQRYRRPSQPNC